MKILHTADWHIGQMFYAYDRAYEHRQFLNWLIQTLQKEKIDVLLISGDVFDLSNPSATSIKLFYQFLNRATKACPDLQIIATAGNHDSATRLESPKPLLESSNIHIIGLINKTDSGDIDYESLAIPLKGSQGKTEAWCLAIPFLRLGDYPKIADSENPYTDGVSILYREAFSYAAAKAEKGQPIIAMGHLHAQKAAVSDMDKQERLIMGGVEGIPVSAFPDELAYIALGHIHKAQRIGGKEHIRYCGSPLPMSFSEIQYKHQVIIFNINKGMAEQINAIEVPVSIPLIKIPDMHQHIAEVMNELEKLPSGKGKEPDKAPYLEVRVLLDGPDPAIRYKIEKALSGKYARLARINVETNRNVSLQQDKEHYTNPDELEKLLPMDVFEKAYHSGYGTEAPEAIRQLFQRAVQESVHNKQKE